jgi:hypothetical protein
MFKNKISTIMGGGSFENQQTCNMTYTMTTLFWRTYTYTYPRLDKDVAVGCPMTRAYKTHAPGL